MPLLISRRRRYDAMIKDRTSLKDLDFALILTYLIEMEISTPLIK
jgi:hypothetical protein